MFETIGALFTIGFWGVAIFLFIVGIFVCIDNLFSGDGWKTTWACISILLGIVTFVLAYVWLESIAFCLLATGIVFSIFANPNEKPPERKPEPGPITDFTTELVKEYATYEREKAAVRDGINESRK